MPELHVYANKIVDWVVAASPEDAIAVAREHAKSIGCADEEADLDGYVQEPDDKVLKIDWHYNGVKVAKTCVEWAAFNGRGFLCSTEY
jgi:hypothetical protein